MSVIIDPVHSSTLNKFAFAGIELSRGLASDTYLTLTPNATLTTASQDAGGGSRSISVDNDPSGKLEFTLKMQSTENLKLNQLVKEQRRNGGIPIFGNFEIEVGGTLFLYQPKQCHIMERPTQSVGKLVDEVNQTWVFDVADLQEIDVNNYVSLNADVKADIQSAINVAFSISIEV